MKQRKSSRDWIFRINDILYSIERIQQYTKKITFTEFKKNQLVIDAVIRNFEIIGEASNHIPKAIQHSHSNIPWKQMISFRNFLIHEYSGVDLKIIWQTAHSHLPVLKEKLKDIFSAEKVNLKDSERH